MFELVRRIQNIDVFMKNLIGAATDLVESKLFRRQRIAFLVDKIGHFQKLTLHHEPMDNSNFLIFFLETPKAQKQSYLSIGFRMRGPKNCSRPTQAPGRPVLMECESFLQHLPQKGVVRTAKKC